jgi:hypothetical protein
MNSTALDRPYQAERTAEQTLRVNVRGIYQAVLFIFIVMCFFNCIIMVTVCCRNFAKIMQYKECYK